LGLAASVLVFAAAPLVAALYSRDELYWIVQALSPIFALNGISSQFRVQINRQFRFAALNTCDIAPIAIALCVTIAMGVNGAGYDALVAQQVVAAATGLVLSVALARWWPSWPSRKGNVRNEVHYG